MQNQIHIREFHQDTFSSGKRLAGLAHADWADAAEPPASL